MQPAALTCKDAAGGPDVNAKAIAGGPKEELGGAVPARKHLDTKGHEDCTGTLASSRIFTSKWLGLLKTQRSISTSTRHQYKTHAKPAREKAGLM